MVATSISVDTDRLSRLVGLGYELPVGMAGEGLARAREVARAFAEDAAEVFQCQLATVEYNDAHDAGRSFVVTGGLDGFEEVFCSARALQLDDTYLTRMRQKPQGTVLLGTEIVTPAEMRRSSSYSALAMPWRLEHFLIGSILTHEAAGAYFALGRTARETPFVSGDKEILKRLLLTHLTRSMTIQLEVATMRSANAVLEAVLHQAPTGVVIFNAHGRPLLINEKSAAVFSAADGLHLIDGKMRADDGACQVELDQSLMAMLQFTQGHAVPAPATVLVSRRSTRRPYRVSFSALGLPGAGAEWPRGSAVLAIIQEERGTYVPTVLRATYGLTRAEVRLCQALVEGQTLLEAARSLDVSRNTAKTHLARIFDKTGVRSQGALLRLLVVGSRH